MSEIFSKTIDAVKRNVVYIGVCAAVFVGGCFAGAFFSGRCEETLLADSANGFFEIVFVPSASVWKYAFSKLIGGIGILIVVTLCGITVWLVPVHVLLVGYFAFVSGVTAVAFYKTFSFVGVGFYVFILLPSSIVRAFAIVLLSVNLICYCKERENKKKDGCSADIELAKLLTFFAFGAAVYFVAVLFESIFLAVIIRPINIYL